MAKKFTQDQITQFVGLYKENPCLWDISSEDYNNKAMRQSALQNMCDGMEIEGFTVENVKNKIKTIRSTYYLELDKIEKWMNSGGNVYKPKMKWFAELDSFIKNVMVKRKAQEYTINTDNAEPRDNENSETNSSEPRMKRSKIPQLSSVVSSMKEMQYNLYESGEDEFDVFGKHVAMQLRTLSPEQAILGQEEIQSVITKCRLRDLK